MASEGVYRRPLCTRQKALTSRGGLVSTKECRNTTNLLVSFLERWMVDNKEHNTSKPFHVPSGFCSHFPFYLSVFLIAEILYHSKSTPWKPHSISKYSITPFEVPPVELFPSDVETSRCAPLHLLSGLDVSGGARQVPLHEDTHLALRRLHPLRLCSAARVMPGLLYSVRLSVFITFAGVTRLATGVSAIRSPYSIVNCTVNPPTQSSTSIPFSLSFVLQARPYLPLISTELQKPP